MQTKINEDTAYKRLIGIDILKIFAIVMVVLTHTNFYAPFPDLYMNTCVPIFMIIAAFNNSRKYSKNKFSRIKDWYNKKNFWGYFKRISIPYLFFMLMEIIILPIVGYAPFSVALLNTVKGGMGPGGYFLFVFAQLFLIFPILIYFYKKNPKITLFFVILIQFLMEELFHYVLIPANEFIFTGMYKLTCFKYLFLFTLGIFIFENFKKIKTWHGLIFLIVGIVLGVMRGFNISSNVFEIDYILNNIQMVSLVFGLVILTIHLGLHIKNMKFTNAIGFVAGSTLHILLFQQLYFCCCRVLSPNSPVYLDLLITLIGGFLIYVVWHIIEKSIKKKKIQKTNL